MPRKTLVIATLICGLALLSGCRPPATSAPSDEPGSTAHDAAATEATNHLVARAGNGDLLPELRSTSGRLKLYEDENAGAATPSTRENPFGGERASCVFVPGYSKDGRYAVVNLAFPWSGKMHSGEVTYLLELTDRGWKVLLRDFIYYV